ncbi:NB-ARC domain-containing protein [Nocardia callitridis]|uniref:AAA+ ATPase domain-containing protein n=1 Tax=Nocardia callitridis TaxID=648753 RepID=A0ABP9KEB6_9NOCA
MTVTGQGLTTWTIEPPPALFVDRDQVLAMVRAAAENVRNTPATVALYGLSGIGKTMLMRRIATDLREQFDIGLSIDFQSSRHGGAVPLDDVLAGVLSDLGVEKRWIPDDLAGKARRFRAVTEGKRVLLLLDGVSDAGQVSILLPNSPHALVIAVSETALTELGDDGAIVHRVLGLAAEYGAELLTRLGVEQAATHPDLVWRLVALVDGSPGIIRILAGHLRSGRGPSLEELVENLDSRTSFAASTESLRLLDRELIGLFADVYDRLPPEAAVLYRVLGQLPGRMMSERIIAAALDLTIREIAQSRETLVGEHLLEQLGDEFGMLDLVRRHARLVAAREADPTELDRAVVRAMNAWLQDAIAGDFALGKERFRVGDVRPSPQARAFGSPAAAMAWFVGKHDDLLAVLRQAAAQEQHSLVWKLFQAMWPFYSTHPRRQAQREAADLAVAAAVADGDRAAEARMLCLRARAFWESGDFVAAEADLGRATESSRAENGPLFASVLDFVGQNNFQQGRYDNALESFEQSLAINERLGDERGIALQSQFRGRCLGKLGRGTQALVAFDRAARLIVPFDDARTASRIAFSRAKVQIALGQRQEAVASLHAARDFAAELGQSMLLADPLELLADIASGIEAPDVVRGYVEQVVQLHRQSGSPELAQWERHLEGLST